MSLAINSILKLFALSVCCTALVFSAPVLSLDTNSAVSLSIPYGSSIRLGSGQLSLGCSDINVQGVLSADNGLINARSMNISSSGRLEGVAGQIVLSGNWRAQGQFIAAQSTVIFGDGCGLSASSIGGVNTFYSLTLTSSMGKEFIFDSMALQTVNGSFVASGVQGLPILLSSSGGAPAIFELDGAKQVDFVGFSKVEIVGGEGAIEIKRLPIWLIHAAKLRAAESNEIFIQPAAKDK